MTMATTVADIRNILQDTPDEDYITAAIVTTSATTMTVNDVTKWAKGQVWEFDDGVTGAELVMVRSVATSTSTITIKRGHLGSTAATHLISAVVLKAPRYQFNEVAQAVNTVIEADLYQEGLYELNEHQITSATTTRYYNSPTANCERFLDVYQKTSSMYEPARADLWYSPLPTNVDTTLFAAGKYFVISGNYGTAGTDIYYVTCAHKLSLSTVNAAEQRIVDLLACAYVLEWSEPKRLGGPNNQGDQTVRPGASLQTAAYYRSLAEELIQKDQQYLKDSYPAKRRFVRA